MSEPNKPSDDASNELGMDIPGPEDVMIDALLTEVFGKATPPNQSTEIMRKLRETPLVTRPAELPSRQSSGSRKVSTAGSGSRTGVSASRANWPLRVVLCIATLAASLVFGFVAWKFNETKSLGINPVATAPGRSVLPSENAVAKVTLPPAIQSPAPERSLDRPIPKGITIAVDTPPSNNASRNPSELTPKSQSNSSVAESIRLVSTRASAGMENYWQAVGVEPSQRAAGDEIRDRLKTRLGVDLDPSWFAVANGKLDGHVDSAASEGIEKSLRSKANARQVSLAWLNEITGGSMKQLPADERDRLITELATAFDGTQPLDAVLASWLRGDSENSSAWYAAVAKGGEYAMLHRLASLTMNVDLRCTRCHDALIESDGRQQDYWSLASMVRRDVARDGKGHWSVRDDNAETKAAPIFYERLDGRQSIADAGIPSRWLRDSSVTDPNHKIATVRQWGDSLVGSRALASGVVNSLWRLVHDRPLHGGVADAASPPLDDTLIGLEELLVDDLVSSNFDVSRLLAIVLSSPATSRSIPETLVRQDAWAMDAAKVRLAEQSVEAFAAAAPSPKSLPLDKRVDLSMRSIGASLKGIDGIGTLLAQPIGVSGEVKEKQPVDASPMTSGFPDHADSVPVQWLSSINGFDSQVKHLGYLAGLERLPPAIEPAALAMRKADVPVELTLHRVWWLLQP